MDLNFFECVIQSEIQVGTYTTQYPVFYKDVSFISVLLSAPLVADSENIMKLSGRAILSMVSESYPV